MTTGGSTDRQPRATACLELWTRASGRARVRLKLGQRCDAWTGLAMLAEATWTTFDNYHHHLAPHDVTTRMDLRTGAHVVLVCI